MDEDIAERFLTELARGMADDERLILCGFVGDPDSAPQHAWRPRPWRPGRDIPFAPSANAYTTVSAFRKAGDGSFRRRVDTFGAGLALMVDDVGTKVAVSKVEHAPPTLRVETSEGNEQWWYLLDAPARDVSEFDAVIRAFIAGKLLGADPGMSGVNRVGRLPGFTNGKRRHKSWRTRVLAADWSRRWSLAALVEAFALTPEGDRFRFRNPKLFPDEDRAARIAAFDEHLQRLARAEMLKNGRWDPSGWTEVRCPWIDDHTGRSDTGAAIRWPDADNQWYGAFRCHHGHCAERGWREFLEATCDEAAIMNQPGIDL